VAGWLSIAGVLLQRRDGAFRITRLGHESNIEAVLEYLGLLQVFKDDLTRIERHAWAFRRCRDNTHRHNRAMPSFSARAGKEMPRACSRNLLACRQSAPALALEGEIAHSRLYHAA
jgi:hypothetical protein